MAAKIRKIKRDQLSDLGEGWDVLTEAEATESGIPVGDDEILVVGTPPPVQPPGQGAGGEELNTLKSRLHTVNQESASRRVALRDVETALRQARDENANLQKQLSELQTGSKKAQAGEVFKSYLTEKKLAFIAPEAADDIRDTVFASIDWTKDVTKEVLAPLVDGAVEKKKYLLKTVELPRTEGGAQGQPTGDTVEIDMSEIANAFGLQSVVQNDKKE